MEQVKFSGLVSTWKKKSRVEYAMKEAHMKLFEGLEIPLS
jgi:hypothetical protein